ncbi:hypothetical protein [Bacillus sp. T3]|uniref:hypothetical protein n=1 Tax=Bacillus sp. T3 TaxID=467262 RepID=UPI002980A4A1|nr:hypothetical protein [Bacillus sp. T3]
MYNSQDGAICQSCGNITLVQEISENKKSGIVYAALGWVFFTVSLLFIPLLFGTAALAMGFMTYHERNVVHGVILMFLSAVSIVLGSLFSFIVAGTMFI